MLKSLLTTAGRIGRALTPWALTLLSACLVLIGLAAWLLLCLMRHRDRMAIAMIKRMFVR